MKYIEVDLKTERFIHSQKHQTAAFLPSREDSYERMLEEGHTQFASNGASPEDELLHSEKINQLRTAQPDEAAFIHALFYEDVSERQLSKRMGIPQRTLHDRKVKILVKLHKLIEN